MKEQIAKILLTTGAVKLSPRELFTFSSGIKSPIYCDNRELLAHPIEREIVIQAFMQSIEEPFDIVAGTATAGIPWASFIADRTQKPMAYVRSSAKAHGRNKQIEGACVSGKTIILLEDLISTGGSVATAYTAMQEAGANTVRIHAIFTYGLAEATTVLSGMYYETICDFTTLVHVANKEGVIKEEDVEIVLRWQKNPRAFQ